MGITLKNKIGDKFLSVNQEVIFCKLLDELKDQMTSLVFKKINSVRQAIID